MYNILHKNLIIGYTVIAYFRAKVLECSAKSDFNVKDIFRTFLTLSKIMPKLGDDSTSGLKRRSSAYVSATSKGIRNKSY